MAESIARAAILLAAMSLAACQVAPTRAPGDAMQVAPERSATTTTAGEDIQATDRLPDIPRPTPPTTAHPPPPAVVAAEATTPEGDVWDRLRDGFMLPGCDYAPETERWARRYAGSPKRFAATLERMLPALDYTQRRMAQAQLPGEFALLPIVESHFEPHPGSASQPAGIWQMIGPTARSAGARMDPWFDGRLNLVESTDAAVALLDRYGDHFNGDWRLAAFAYNAGEYRIKRALDVHEPGEDFASLRGLGIARTSYEYLTKLLALSCLIREPERFDLRLPELADGRELVEIELDGVVGISLARALSGLSNDDFARVNGGLLKGRTPPGDDHRLLVSAGTAQRSSQVAGMIPAALRLDWQQRRLLASESLEDIAQRNGLLLDTLLAINNQATVDGIAPDTALWLPGRASHREPDRQIAAASSGFHIVRSGDSLWTIARRHGLTVVQLMRYNAMNTERLMPGQRLRLTPP